MKQPYEVLVYWINEDDVEALGPELVFAKDKETAERMFLSSRGDKLGHIIEEVKVCSRPF